jgi:hypothetical protein
MVSISTLFAFWMVALALIWHRYCQPLGSAPPLKHRAVVGAHMGVIVAASVGELVLAMLHVMPLHLLIHAFTTCPC